MKHQKHDREARAADLLEEILQETEEAARVEHLARERCIEERRELQRRQEESERAQRLENRRRKLEAELERQRQISERRSARLRALRGDTTAPPAPLDEGPSTKEGPARPSPAHIREVTALTPLPSRSKGSTSMSTAAAAVIALLFGLGFVAFDRTHYQPDATPYAKTVFAPSDRGSDSTEVAVTVLPPAAATRSYAEAPSPPPKKKPVRTAPRDTPPKPPASSFARPATNEHHRAVSELESLLNSDTFDPFSMP